MLDSKDVMHNSQNIYYRSTVGAAEAGSQMRLGILLRTKESIKQVLLHTWADGTGEKWSNLSTKDNAKAPEKFYSLTIKMPERGGLMWYFFIVVTSDRTYYYGNNHELLGGVGELYDHIPPAYQITVYQKGAKTPDWFKHSVMYQIFPDRFYRDGNEIIEKEGAVYHAKWSDDPMYFKDVTTKEIVAYDFFGGNLRGVEKKLDYLKDLGISAIYFNPVFESESNHHYDTGDYHKIDPILGTNEDFKHLIDTAKAKGIRIIIDGVFSHTGSNSKYFNRDGKYDTVGAFQSKDSPYYEWYDFRNYPTDYDSWWNFHTLPNVRETTPSYMDFIIRDKNSVLKHWMREGISGWRLDVIDELPAEFSRLFFAELKKINPDAVMIGEVWEDASNKIAYGVQRQYLCGYEMDSAMNYPLRAHIFDFILGQIDGELCMRRMESLRENYPKENFYAMMNLISSHDIMRPMTIFGEAPYYDQMPAQEQSRFKLDAEAEKLGKARLKMAALWQMTYPGVPCIYYGDEVGMQGFKDPTNRRPYPWGGGDQDLLKTYKKFIALRNEKLVLQTGELLPLPSKGDIVAFARVIRNGHDVFGVTAENDIYLAAFNRSKTRAKEVSFDVSDFANGVFVDAFDEENPKCQYHVTRGRVTFTLGALEGILLHHIPQQQNYDRRAGILLHPTCLPSKYGIGDLGKEAFDFVDYLKSAGQSIWQILPLNPVGFGYSPYQSPSAFAGNPMLISIDSLIEFGLLEEDDVKVPAKLAKNKSVDFEAVEKLKDAALAKAFENFKERLTNDAVLAYDFKTFCENQSYWLDDYALFDAIKQKNDDTYWVEWDAKIKQRDKKVLTALRKELADGILFTQFEQFVFNEQWKKLHKYALDRGIEIMGDMPIFVSADSADAWANQSEFMLDKDGHPEQVAGVPPDYFSATGQLWGNPQYNWKVMAANKYKWWKLRFKRIFEMVDIVRVDHFRAFESYWAIPGDAKTAMEGEWIKGPGLNFFTEIHKEIGDAQIVAEDLGIITDAVDALRQDCGFPGMKVLHFSLNYNEDGRIGFVAPENSITYTGTHDNNTTVGWFMEDIDNDSKATIAALIDADVRRPDDVCKKLIEFAYASNSRFTIIPMQDILRLDSHNRMNTPGTVGTNWGWRLKPDYATEAIAPQLKALCNKYLR
ncbi:MAG: 4-alpha-glucanotransferase [Selenomonadaceae bacterium]|nr:4-alpha-glucanotransferase [Selenomonadaceae bacterium]